MAVIRQSYLSVANAVVTVNDFLPTVILSIVRATVRDWHRKII